MTSLFTTLKTAATYLLAKTPFTRGALKPLVFFPFLFFPLFLVALPSESTIRALGLTPKEVQWLARNPVVRLGFDHKRPPYDFANEKGEHQGILSSYYDYFEQLLGISFIPVQTSSWEALFEHAQQGKIDLLSGIAKTDERTRYLLFSKPLFDVTLSVVLQRNRVLFNSLEELNKEPVGMVRAYATAMFVKQQHPTLNIVDIPSLKEGLRMVKNGELAAVVAEDFSLQYYLEEYEFRSLYAAHPLLLHIPICIGVHQDHPLLLSILQKALNHLSDEQKQALWKPWIQKKEPAFNVVGFLLVLLFFALGGLAWSSMLFFHQRKKAQQLLGRTRLAKKHLQVASKAMELGTWLWYIKNNINTINPAYARLLGYEKKEFNETFEHFTSLISPEDLPLMYTALKRHLDGAEPYYNVHMRMRHKNGNYVWIRSCGGVLKRDADGYPEILGGWHMKIDRPEETHAALTQYLDPVTGLFSDHFYKVLVPLHIRRARREHTGVALMLVEIADIHLIEETYGTTQANQALQAVSLMLQGKLFHPSGMLFRMNPTTFCLLFWFDVYKEAHAFELTLQEHLRSIELFVKEEPLLLSIHTGASFMFPGSYIEEQELYQHAYANLKKNQASDLKIKQETHPLLAP